jgi:tetratricopeptide (TPR) repeat protein
MGERRFSRSFFSVVREHRASNIEHRISSIEHRISSIVPPSFSSLIQFSVVDSPRIEQLRRRVSADPASIAFAALAEEYQKEGRYPEAIETCRLGLQRHPAYLSARVTLGRALVGLGDYEAARLELEAVLRIAPENLAAIRAMADIYGRLQQSEELPMSEALSDQAPDEASVEPAPAAVQVEAPPRLRVVPLEPPPHSNARAIARLERFLDAITTARARGAE